MKNRGNSSESMLKLIDRVKAGIEKPYVVSNAVITKRTARLNLSFYKQIIDKDRFIGSIQHTQADNCEGRFLLTGRSDGTLLLHNIKRVSALSLFGCDRLWQHGKHDKSGHRYSVECVRWFPTDNGIFVSASFDKTLKIWDTSRLQCVDTLTFNGKVYNFDLSSARTRNCTVAACTSQGVVSIFELQTGTNVHTLKQHAGDVLTCNWSPLDEHILCTGATDNRVLLWDIRSAKSCLMSLNRCNTIQTKFENPCENNFTAHTGSVNCVKFVRGGLKLITCGTDNVIRLWDTLTGKNELVDYDGFKNNSKRSIHVDVLTDTSPEFAFVPSCEVINVYEVESGKLVNSLGGHFGDVNCVNYEPLQQELYSGGTDGLMLIWRDETEMLGLPMVANFE